MARCTASSSKLVVGMHEVGGTLAEGAAPRLPAAAVPSRGMPTTELTSASSTRWTTCERAARPEQQQQLAASHACCRGHQSTTWAQLLRGEPAGLQRQGYS